MNKILDVSGRYWCKTVWVLTQVFLILSVSTQNIFLSFLCSSTTEWKISFCGVLETHFTDRFWKREDAEPWPHFRQFLDGLIGENDVGSKIVQRFVILKATQLTWWFVCVCVFVSGGLDDKLIFGIKCFSKAISLHFLYAPILLFQLV